VDGRVCGRWPHAGTKHGPDAGAELDGMTQLRAIILSNDSGGVVECSGPVIGTEMFFYD